MPAGRILLYTASIGAFALVVRSIAMGPLPMFVSALALGAYVAIILCGVFFLRLGMFVDVVTRGPEGARGVALTFDDGPSPRSTPAILDLLDEAKAKATFFVIGRKAEQRPDLVREILSRGHAVALHSYAHHRLFSLKSARYVRDDLTKAIAVLAEITGDKPVLFRPPIGHTHATLARVVKELGLEVIGWSVRALDGVAAADPRRVAARVPGACPTYELLGSGKDNAKLAPELRAEHSTCVQKHLSLRDGPGGRYGSGTFRAAEGAMALWRETERALRQGLEHASPEARASITKDLAVIEPATQRIGLRRDTSTVASDVFLRRA